MYDWRSRTLSAWAAPATLNDHRENEVVFISESQTRRTHGVVAHYIMLPTVAVGKQKHINVPPMLTKRTHFNLDEQRYGPRHSALCCKNDLCSCALPISSNFIIATAEVVISFVVYWQWPLINVCQTIRTNFVSVFCIELFVRCPYVTMIQLERI